MKKKNLLVLATAAALAGSIGNANAQSADAVTLYGRVYLMFESIKASGGNPGAPDIGSRNRVEDYSSLLGVRGTENLGGGLKAIFQLETAFRGDSNDNANGGGTTFANRNSAVGVEGNFGTVIFGRWDSPMKRATIRTDPFANLTMGDSYKLMSDRGNFNRRQQNTMQWWSPTWAGFEINAAQVANERRGVGPTGANPSDTSIAATYTRPGVYVGYSWERHRDQFRSYTASSVADIKGGSEVSQALFGNFDIGPLKVGLNSQVTRKQTGTAATVTDTKNQHIALTYTSGKSRYVVSYITLKGGLAPTAAIQPDSKRTALGYLYNFSRRTTLVAVYGAFTNNSVATVNVGLDGVTPGQDTRVMSVGLRHTF